MSIPLIGCRAQAYILWDGTVHKELLLDQRTEKFGWEAIYRWLVARQMEATQRFKQEMGDTPVEMWIQTSCIFVSESWEVSFNDRT